MSTNFKLKDRLAGYAGAATKAGEKVPVVYRELIGPAEASHLTAQLEQLQRTLFSKIPNLPLPSTIDHLLVTITNDLDCVAYVNELNIVATAQVNKAVTAGALVYEGDIQDVTSVDLGVQIPNDVAFVFVRSQGWKRSLLFDFGPILPEVGARKFLVEQALARQAMLLLGIPADAGGGGATRLAHMAGGVSRLEKLLSDRVSQESQYQELLAEHPWMLGGGLYSRLERHAVHDDRNIPDFTALRAYDGCHDIVELKQPFLRLFLKKDGFSVDFNSAWEQAERYLIFAQRQHSYLREEKDLKFENPRCLLLIGHDLTEAQRRKIRDKEGLGGPISVFTYNHLLETARSILQLVRSAGERPFGGTVALPTEPPETKSTRPSRKRSDGPLPKKKGRKRK